MNGSIRLMHRDMAKFVELLATELLTLLMLLAYIHLFIMMASLLARRPLLRLRNFLQSALHWTDHALRSTQPLTEAAQIHEATQNGQIWMEGKRLAGVFSLLDRPEWIADDGKVLRYGLMVEVLAAPGTHHYGFSAGGELFESPLFLEEEVEILSANPHVGWVWEKSRSTVGLLRIENPAEKPSVIRVILIFTPIRGGRKRMAIYRIPFATLRYALVVALVFRTWAFLFHGCMTGSNINVCMGRAVWRALVH